MYKILLEKLIILIAVFGLVCIIFLIFSYYKINNQPSILIVPHQNVPNSNRSDLFKKIAKERNSTNNIVILSPDHFSFTGRGLRYTSDGWRTENGEIEFGDIFPKDFLLRMIDDPAVKQDHGISNLIPDIQNSFPEAKIVPILIGMNMELIPLQVLIEEINSRCKNDCLVIASVDFSHYLPYPVANVHDRFAISILERNDIYRASDLEVDSQESLNVVMNLAKRRNLHFNTFAVSNSAEISRSSKAESTGHVLGFYSNHLPVSFLQIDSFIVSRNSDDLEIFPRYLYGVNKKFLGIKQEIEINNLHIIPSDVPQFEIICSDSSKNILLGQDVLLTGEFRDGKTYLYPVLKHNVIPEIMESPCYILNKSLSEIVLD